jgi:hypothetical protein
VPVPQVVEQLDTFSIQTKTGSMFVEGFTFSRGTRKTDWPESCAKEGTGMLARKVDAKTAERTDRIPMKLPNRS